MQAIPQAVGWACDTARQLKQMVQLIVMTPLQVAVMRFGRDSSSFVRDTNSGSPNPARESAAVHTAQPSLLYTRAWLFVASIARSHRSAALYMRCCCRCIRRRMETVTLSADDGTFLCSLDDGRISMEPKALECEQYEMHIRGANLVAFKTRAGAFLSATDCVAEAPGFITVEPGLFDRELFAIEFVNDKIMLRTYCGTYLQAPANEFCPVQAIPRYHAAWQPHLCQWKLNEVGERLLLAAIAATATEIDNVVDDDAKG